MSAEPTATETASASSSQPWSDIRVFNPPNAHGPARIPPIQDDDPRPTASELKAAFSSHIEQRHGPDAPLMTQAMREREEARLGIRKKEYNEARIRIRFSDRTILEATLPSSVEISSLYAFLRSHLDSNYQQKSFTIYQAPPKRDFPENPKDPKMKGKSLKELGMAPQASLNIRWEDAAMNSNTFPAPLENSLKQKAEALPTPPSFENPAGSDKSTSKSQSSDGGTAKKVMPKWLKGLQKK